MLRVADALGLGCEGNDRGEAVVVIGGEVGEVRTGLEAAHTVEWRGGSCCTADVEQSVFYAPRDLKLILGKDLPRPRPWR